MRIVVNDIAASKTGALSVLRDFHAFLADNEKEHEWIFLLSSDYVEETDNIKVLIYDDVKKSRIERLKFDYLYGRKRIEELSPDVYFSLQNTLIRGLKCRKVVYVHQPLGFQNEKVFSFLKKEEREYAIYQHLISKLTYSSIKNADLTIVQTEWMLKEVIKKTGISREKIVNILPDTGRIEAVNKESKTDSRDFFYPAGDILYKNHRIINEAVSLLRDRGIDDFRVFLTITRDEFIKRCDLEPVENIKCLGRIDRERVIDNYGKMILLFPSYIETFGYPLAEGRQIGTTILSSDCAFSREILKGYDKVYYFDPFDKTALADLMEKCIRGNIPVNAASAFVHSTENDESSWSRVVKELTDWK
ncbi:MAG: glycosyltransferase [Lachnospiraceae bacterium]|nr:glycosyltransferase [Lachnospiraceae bacterium]